MALTNNTLPSIRPEFIVPLDASMQFASAQTLTATGFINNTNAVLTVGPGRFKGRLALDITAIDVSSGNETYQIEVIGSNDAAFGNGNCDCLAFIDYAAATAGRIVPTLLAASPTIPPTGRAGMLDVVFFSNYRSGFVYSFIKLNLTAGGTTPSITLSAWVAPEEVCQG